VKDYFCCSSMAEKAKFEEKIEKKFSDFKGYLDGILSSRARMIRTIFTFYYDNIAFINTDMQHGLTRSESPDVIDFLRETTSGSQTEVPKLLSLPDRETAYFTGLKAVVEEQLAAEADEHEKASLQEQLKKIESSITIIRENIKILDVLERLDGKLGA